GDGAERGGVGGVAGGEGEEEGEEAEPQEAAGREGAGGGHSGWWKGETEERRTTGARGPAHGDGSTGRPRWRGSAASGGPEYRNAPTHTGGGRYLPAAPAPGPMTNTLYFGDNLDVLRRHVHD